MGREKLKLSLFADDILYVENLKTSQKKKKLLETINEFSKASGYKINTQNLLFLYTSLYILLILKNNVFIHQGFPGGSDGKASA